MVDLSRCKEQEAVMQDPWVIVVGHGTCSYKGDRGAAAILRILKYHAPELTIEVRFGSDTFHVPLKDCTFPSAHEVSG